jgi:hypothetical protein
VDAKIRRVKETYRNVKLGLPWKLPKVLVKDLVAYVVSRLNIRRTTALNENVCPRVLFTGAPVDYKKELQVAFGDYVEAYEGTDNTSRARSSACIALYPAGNLSGSWVLWKIETRTRVRRTNMKKMITSDLIVQAMNATAAESRVEEAIPEAAEVVSQQPTEAEAIEQIAETEEVVNPVNDPRESAEDEPLQVEESGEPEIAVGDATQQDDGEPNVTTRSGRTVHRPLRYMQVTKVSKEDWKTEASTVAIEAELRMLFQELKVLRCVRRASIKAGTKILKSHMFVHVRGGEIPSLWRVRQNEGQIGSRRTGSRS